MSDTTTIHHVAADTMQFFQNASDPFAALNTLVAQAQALPALASDPAAQITLSDIGGVVTFTYLSSDPNAVVTRTTDAGGVTTITFDAHTILPGPLSS